MNESTFDFHEEVHLLRSEAESITFIKKDYLTLRSILYHSASFLSLFTLPLILRFFSPKRNHTLPFKSVMLNEATHILIETLNSKPELLRICIVFFENRYHRVVEFKHHRFILNEQNEFQLITPFHGLSDTQIKNGIPLHQGEAVENSRSIFGANDISTPITPLLDIVFGELLSLVNLYQFFVCFCWYFRNYATMSNILIVVTFFNIVYTLYEIRSAENALHLMTKLTGEVKVERYSDLLNEPKIEKISLHSIVPKDIVVLTSNMIVPCDILLIEGELLVNEAILTGESVPALKRASDGPIIKDNLIYCGCSIMRVSGGSVFAKGIAIKTGFHSVKGTITRDILYPKITSYKFERQANYFMLILLGVILLFQGWYVYWNIIIHPPEDGELIYSILVGMDILFTGLPPILIVALMIGRTVASHELKRIGIQCYRPHLINAIGRVKTFCFDKTGTLTTNSMRMEGVVEFTNLQSKLIRRDQFSGMLNQDVIKILLGCHNIVIDGVQMVGDPMEIEILASVSGTFDMHSENRVISPLIQGSVNRIQLFDFKSKLQRMSVIAEIAGDHLICTKGSPEMIKKLCNESSLPRNYEEVLLEYSKMGLRVLAIASRKIDNKMPSYTERTQIETNLQFKGFVIMKNQLKSKTNETLQELNSSDIRVCMITGDNLQTAAAISRECNIIKPFEHEYNITVGVHSELIFTPHKSNSPKIDIHTKDLRDCIFSITGAELPLAMSLEGSRFRSLLPNIRVFARVSPQQKRQIVRYLKEENLSKDDTLVGYCGDGANDTLALKEADIGISLSKEESSLASPFMTQQEELTTIPEMLKIGRGALASNFQNFKFFLFEAIVQDICLLVSYYDFCEISSDAYLWLDLLCACTMTYLLMKIPYKKTLTKALPTNTLVSFETLLDFWVLLFLSAVMLLGARAYSKYIPNYKPPTQVKNELEGVFHRKLDYSKFLVFETMVNIVFLNLG